MANEILIVDDEADIRVLTAGILQDEGFQTREAANSTEALAAVESRRPNLVLLDIWLQGSDLDGLGILKALKKDHPTIPVLMMSGHGTVETAVTALQDGAYDFIEKPFKADRLILLVERAIETDHLRRENEELRLRAGTANELIGVSQAARDMRQAIERIAPSNSRVLITGPAGSGKEVVARMLHGQSHRAEGPFVVVNCATMSPDRFEMELFGSENPIGDSETPQKVGTFEAAHNGTLFLDEVADMPLETQGKIVRVLQEQVFERVGGATRVEVDVRVMAASTADLVEEISAGNFREDFFYRLNVVPLEVVPLKHKLDDIPPLAEHFMEQAARATGQPARTIGKDALTMLQAYSWPGNVRELKNVIERLLIMASGDAASPISADMLPPEINADAPVGGSLETSMEIMGLPLRDAREIFEREYLVAQVTRFGGNISKTAEFIGMERSALHRKLKSLGVRSEDRQ
ncbi:MAG: sigma-54-dependent Fis family transcriptional regulator [Alphaproteobacteria bacterium]|nr:sigma-54-dependent Fis family transcriptional regulator [Alphaproteobacteria bacterium]